MRLLSRILAVVAASGIWLFIPGGASARPQSYPVWPSFSSTGCSALQGPGGSTSVSCGQGSFLLSQVAIGYVCNQLDISVTSFQSGSFLVVGTALDGTQNNTITIDGTGNYFMQFPQPLVQNLVTLQMTAGGSGAIMTVDSITGSPCAVSTSTDTPNPSFTTTNTPVPVTGTPTAIPTHTPLPSGHSTFTPTNTPLPGSTSTNTATATATSTPGPSERDCGDFTFPVLNCDFTLGFIRDGSNPDHWVNSANSASFVMNCWQNSSGATLYPETVVNFPNHAYFCKQTVTAHGSGVLVIRYQLTSAESSGVFRIGAANVGTSPTEVNLDQTGCAYLSVTYCTISVIAGVVSGDSYDFGPIGQTGDSTERAWFFYIDNVWVSPTGSTLTPVPATATVTGTPTNTSTPVPGTPTNTPIPSDTPIPIPGAMSTAIATSTECPGGCAVTALTAIPGMATRVMVDTSPFSQLQHLSLARNGCTAFGYVQIPYPVIHGTPVLGSPDPLNVTWTLPVTHDWDNTNPYSNTAIEPCAMDEIPTSIWDFTYWLSVMGCSIVFIMWLIGFVGRLSGDETING